MPFKDPKQKLAYQAEWRKRSIRNGYGKWLYDRRALRFADAEHFREALERIAATSKDEATRKIARRALADSRKRESELGPSPAVTPKRKEHKHPKYADDSLLKLLSTLEK
jgi:hypothetical protein